MKPILSVEKKILSVKLFNLS